MADWALDYTYASFLRAVGFWSIKPGVPSEETITLHVSNAYITDFRPIFGRASQGVGMDIMMPNEKAAITASELSFRERKFRKENKNLLF